MSSIIDRVRPEHLARNQIELATGAWHNLEEFLRLFGFVWVFDCRGANYFDLGDNVGRAALSVMTWTWSRRELFFSFLVSNAASETGSCSVFSRASASSSPHPHELPTHESCSKRSCEEYFFATKSSKKQLHVWLHNALRFHVCRCKKAAKTRRVSMKSLWKAFYGRQTQLIAALRIENDQMRASKGFNHRVTVAMCWGKMRARPCCASDLWWLSGG